jgi:hypothetical protein
MGILPVLRRTCRCNSPVVSRCPGISGSVLADVSLWTGGPMMRSMGGQTTTARDCTELQALHEGLVVFDATRHKTEDDLGLRISGGTGLVDSKGIRVVPRPVDPPQDAGLVAVFTELTRRFGFR